MHAVTKTVRTVTLCYLTMYVYIEISCAQVGVLNTFDKNLIQLTHFHTFIVTQTLILTNLISE